MDRHKQGRGRHQHFIGSWARLNCENMPVIPAWLMRRNLEDPRRIPYLLVWKDEIHDGKIMEVVRLAHFVACGREANDYVELKRADESTTVLRIVWRMLPRNGGRALFLLCPHCDTPRRHVYGWEWDSVSGWSNRVTSISWRCRSCARLRYSSEGGYLCGLSCPYPLSYCGSASKTSSARLLHYPTLPTELFVLIRIRILCPESSTGGQFLNAYRLGASELGKRAPESNA